MEAPRWGKLALRLVTAALGLVIAFVALVAIEAPFLLPNWAYAATHGWRYPKTWTCGTATFTDEGPATSNDRFVADLGQLSVTSPGTHRHQLCQLPEAQLWVGFVLPLATPSDWLRGSTVSVTLVDQSGIQIAAHAGSLVDDWTWSGPLDGKVFYHGAVWFDADPAMQYELLVEVQSTRSSRARQARLVVKGGGWK